MLYLYGASGTTYYYIHLNNDLTRGDDNGGKCVAGTAYAPGLKDGAKVAVGQPVGFVGDSGDADGVHAHLHFEVHPGGGKAVDGYPYLQTAQHLLFAAPKGKPFTLELNGTVMKPGSLTLQVKANTVHAWPMGQHQTKLHRPLLLNVPDTAVVQSTTGSSTRKTPILSARIGQPVKISTRPPPSTGPRRAASAASTTGRVKTSSVAWPRVVARARRGVPPQPGMIPRLLSGCPSFAVLAAQGRSQPSGTSRPPPRAKPLTAAIV